MAENADHATVKDEPKKEPQENKSKQDGEQREPMMHHGGGGGQQHQNFGQRRGGGPNRFGNRRPGPYAENADHASVKDEPKKEPPQENNGKSQQDGEQGEPMMHHGGGGGGQQQNFGPRRGGGPNRFGNPNRRPGPYNNRGEQGGGDGNGNFNNRRRGPPGGGGGQQRDGNNRNDDRGPGMRGNFADKVNERLAAMAGPTYDLPPLDMSEKKFSGRTRLYVGNLPHETTEEDISEMFRPFGEINEVFLNKEKNFAFIRVDYRNNAERAKNELDGVLFKGRNLKVRFAPCGATIKVKSLTSFVTNELLFNSFGVFGEIERAYIIVDERGKSTGEGIVEFARKGYALNAIRQCSEGCFFLTASLRPCIVENYEPVEECDGLPERTVPKKHPEYLKEREVGPRFANPSSFEFDYGMRWKQIHDLYVQKEEALKKEKQMEIEKLSAQMEFARYEHETEMLRDQLRNREMDRDRQKQEWELRERMAEEQRQRNEEQLRRQQEEMQTRMVQKEDDMRRRQQENTLFMQANQLNSILDQEEQSFDGPQQGFNSNSDNGGLVEPKAFLNSFKRGNSRFDGGRGDMGPNGPRNGDGGGGRGHWVNNDNRHDNFMPKRRRF